jgi:aquaporin Z
VGGPLKAFIAEGIVTFILMLALLLAINSKKLKMWAGTIAGALICLYLMFEEPYSGMSMNPARTFASAFAAREWTGLWIYFTAPIIATLLAAEVFLRFTRGQMHIPHLPMAEEEPEAEPKPAAQLQEVNA